MDSEIIIYYRYPCYIRHHTFILDLIFMRFSNQTDSRAGQHMLIYDCIVMYVLFYKYCLTKFNLEECLALDIVQ